MVKPVVTGLGFQLWGIEYFTQGRQSVLKIYIDAEGGVDIDDCARVSRQLGSVLDVEDAVKGKYILEVSSPGMDRRLFTMEQYDDYRGAEVKLRLRSPYNGKRKYTGRLCGIEDSDVVLRVGDEEYLFPFEEVDKANVIPSFE